MAESNVAKECKVGLTLEKSISVILTRNEQKKIYLFIWMSKEKAFEKNIYLWFLENW